MSESLKACTSFLNMQILSWIDSSFGSKCVFPHIEGVLTEGLFMHHFPWKQLKKKVSQFPFLESWKQTFILKCYVEQKCRATKLLSICSKPSIWDSEGTIPLAESGELLVAQNIIHYLNWIVQIRLFKLCITEQTPNGVTKELLRKQIVIILWIFYSFFFLY